MYHQYTFCIKLKKTIENFKILASCDRFDLRLLESLFIQKLKPSLNDQHSSTDLLIVN